jgi:MFS family permease
VLIGLTSFVPTYLEAVLSVTPIVSGLSLAALTIGWPLAAGQAGRIYMRVGFRTTVIAGGFVAVLGAALVASFGPAPSLIAMTIGCFVVGVGLGLLAVPSLVAAQSSVEWNERGVVTGNQLFARSMGSAVGVAIFGAVANGIFTARGATDAAAVEAASTAVFIGVAVAAVLALVAAFTMPRDRASALAGETERGGTATTDPAAA